MVSERKKFQLHTILKAYMQFFVAATAIYTCIFFSLDKIFQTMLQKLKNTEASRWVSWRGRDHGGAITIFSFDSVRNLVGTKRMKKKKKG